MGHVLNVPGRIRDGHVENVTHRLRVAERLAEVIAPNRLHVLQKNSILRTLRPSHGRLNDSEIQLQCAAESRCRRSGGAEQTLFLVVTLDEIHLVFRAAGASQVVERFVVDREEAHRRSVFRSHIGDRRAIGE